MINLIIFFSDKNMLETILSDSREMHINLQQSKVISEIQLDLRGDCFTAMLHDIP